jgi:adenosylcobinamide-phosphate synthase
LLTLIIALLIEQLLGEPRRFHPLMGFGRCVQWLELILRSTPLFNRHERLPARLQVQVSGVAAVMLILLTLTLIVYWCEALLASSVPLRVLVSSMLVYFCIAPKSLSEHVMAIFEPLQRADIDAARAALAMVSSPPFSGSACEVCTVWLSTVRLVAFSYALMGQFSPAMASWRQSCV